MLKYLLLGFITTILSFISSLLIDKKNKGKILQHVKNGLIAVLSLYLVNLFIRKKPNSYLNQPISTGNPSF